MTSPSRSEPEAAGRVKLTKAQRRELVAMDNRSYRSHYPMDYEPVRRLYELGLVNREISLHGRAGSATYAITPAGRLALTEAGRATLSSLEPDDADTQSR